MKGCPYKCPPTFVTFLHSLSPHSLRPCPQPYNFLLSFCSQIYSKMAVLSKRFSRCFYNALPPFHPFLNSLGPHSLRPGPQPYKFLLSFCSQIYSKMAVLSKRFSRCLYNALPPFHPFLHSLGPHSLRPCLQPYIFFTRFCNQICSTMTSAQHVTMLFLTSFITMTLSSSPTCPLPLQAKSGDQSSVHVTVYYCYQLNDTAPTICDVKYAEHTLRKGLVTNLNHDVNGYALLAKFYGREICTSYRNKVLLKKIGEPFKKIRTLCEKDCFTGNTMVDIDYDYVCDGKKCQNATEKLKFIVTSGTHRFHSFGRINSFIVALVFIVWSIF